MTEFTRPATWDDVIALGRALESAGARYALIGGYALSAHGYQRFSEDIDILVDPSPTNTPRWVAALSSLPDGAAKELEGDRRRTIASAAGARALSRPGAPPWRAESAEPDIGGRPRAQRSEHAEAWRITYGGHQIAVL
jgi:hypothetical protein